MSMHEKLETIETDKARNLLRDAIESLSEGFALYDEDRCLVMCNKRYEEMNSAVADIFEPGLNWEILMRETARRGVYVDAIGREDEWVAEQLESGGDFIQDYELQQTDRTWYLVSVHPTELGGFVVTRTDITEKKNAEIREREGDILVRTVLDASSAVVIMARVGDGEILYRSPAALDLYGNTKSAKEHYASAEDRADYVTQLLADGKIDNLKTTFINAKGEPFPASMSGRIVDYKGEEVIVSSITDLTVQTEAEALTRKVLEACPAPIQMTNAETGNLIFTSRDTTTLSGASLGTRTYYVNPDGRETFIKKVREKGWVHDHKTELKDEQGRRFWGAISARLIEFNGEAVIVSSTRDLTDELAIDEELTSQRELLFQNEKMSALGELLAGVAHELNNPLSVVVGHSLMLQEEAKDQETLRRVEKISKAAERCAKIVKTFLAMARQQPAKMEQTDLNSIIQTAVDVAGYGGKNDAIKISCTLGKDLPEITADADQITQVIINLLINAEQAMTNAGTGSQIKVSTQANPPKGIVEIFVEDNGPGIPDRIKMRIFEPFFTTKDVGEGTGIGLAFCHRIILSHGGQIWLDHDYQEGSRFGINLPVTTSSETEICTDQPIYGIAASGRVLIIDDEVDVGELTSEILRKEGFITDLVHGGSDALILLNQNRYDIVLSDLNMPEMDGHDLYEIIKRDFPEIQDRTAFITGDIMGKSSQRLLRESNRPYLEKPVSPSELRELVHDLLNNAEDMK